jgi:hypothetical protein
VEALDRWKAGRPPKRPLPSGDRLAEGVPAANAPGSPPPGPRRSRHVGFRLAQADFERLSQMARAHAVAPGTMARMLIVRAVRAAADANPGIQA